MSQLDEVDVVAIEDGLRRHWGLVMGLGVTSLLVGIIMLVWPGKTVVVVAILTAIWLIVSGVFQIIRGFRRGMSGGLRALLFISGALSLILGLIAIDSVFQAVEILAILIGIAFLFQAFGQFFSAAESSAGRGWNIFGGIVMLVGGLVIFGWPGLSLAVMAWVVGIWLVIGGIFEIFAAMKLRSAAKAA